MKPSVSTRLVYTCVQKIINSASLCVEIGQYDRAIVSLGKALNISRSYIEESGGSKKNTDGDGEETKDSSGDTSTSIPTEIRAEAEAQNTCYRCSLCSLDECIHFSEDYHRNSPIHRTLRNRQEETIRRRFIQRRQERRAESSENHSSNSYFFYRRLIQVPPLSKNQSYCISSQAIVNLSLISIFNLAVAYHLRAIDHASNRRSGEINSSGRPSQSADLLKAIKLYEVAYSALQKQFSDGSNIQGVSAENKRASVQFGLILCNNLSHAHSLAGNSTQHKRYLKEVLSVTMSLIDYNQRPWNNDEERNRYGSNRRCYPRCIDLEGFLDNTAPLITEAVCADAA